MTSETASHLQNRTTRRRLGRRWISHGGVVFTILAIYAISYLSSRSGHRDSNRRLTIEIGSRTSSRIFAPAIWLEKRIRDRPTADPGSEFDAILAEARTSRRTVLVVLGLESCLPCRQLEHFLDQQRPILSKYFVILQANFDDPESPGQLIHDRYRTKYEFEGYLHYFPWIAFVDGSGVLLVTADDGPDGQIGIPQGGPRDRAWFVRMLSTANPAITADEIAQLNIAAQAYHDQLWRKEGRER